MTDDEWNALKPYAEAEANARLASQNAGLMNQQTEPRARIEQSLEYERLGKEWQAARHELSKAMERVLGPKDPPPSN